MRLFGKIKTSLSKVSVKRWIELIAMLIGLFVDVVALLSFISFVNTPKESPLFYVSSQEFLVWSLIAVLYSLGYFNAKISKRWEDLNKEVKHIEINDFSWMFNKKRDFLKAQWFQRRYSLALITSFPFDYLYFRAASASFSQGEASPWIAFILAFVLSPLIAVFVLLLGDIFRAALSFKS
ncbi:MAG: hypothetical protein HN392_14505 [Anaerolineae bacterium]|jgi:hypothetical protein|nr:hypothetical protein [Anaerolineae bacterium]